MPIVGTPTFYICYLFTWLRLYMLMSCFNIFKVNNNGVICNIPYLNNNLLFLC